jgi:hypothetical protein
MMDSAPQYDREAEERGRRLVEVFEATAEMFNRMSPAERDRIQQSHLAAARGPRGNFRLVLEGMDLLLKLRREQVRNASEEAGT